MDKVRSEQETSSQRLNIDQKSSVENMSSDFTFLVTSWSFCWDSPAVLLGFVQWKTSIQTQTLSLILRCDLQGLMGFGSTSLSPCYLLCLGHAGVSLFRKRVEVPTVAGPVCQGSALSAASCTYVAVKYTY